MLYSTDSEIENMLESGAFLATYKPLLFMTNNDISFKIEYIYFNKMRGSLVFVLDFPHYIEVDYTVVKGRLSSILGCSTGNKVFEILLN